MITRNDLKAQLELIWNALQSYREYSIPEGNDEWDAEWNEITSIMAWWEEDLNNVQPVENL